jgi:alpha-mannosidase
MNRFDCTLNVLPCKPVPAIKPKNGKFTFKTDDLLVEINTETGFVDKYSIRGKNMVEKGAFQPIVIQDDEDPWHMRTRSFPNVIGAFSLMNKTKGSEFSGLPHKRLDSVRIIEDGDVRTVVEAVFSYGDSFICQHYKLPKQGTEIEIELRVYWNEKDKMLKLLVPTLVKKPKYIGQVAYGVSELPSNGDEAVSQKWCAVVSQKDDMAFTAINDSVYGSDCKDGELRITLLRSPAYSGHPIPERDILPQDRFMPRIDQGERIFRFWFNGGKTSDVMKHIDRDALGKNEKPFALSFFPCGQGEKPKPGPYLSDGTIQITAVKKSEKGNNLIVRLFEPTGKKRTTTLTIPAIGFKEKIQMKPFEIKTLKINAKTKKAVEVNLLEK